MRKMEQGHGAHGFCLPKLLMFAFLVLDVVFVGAEFENSWTMYKEQPCCSGSGSHHVRHHRGRHSQSTYTLIFDWRNEFPYERSYSIV